MRTAKTSHSSNFRVITTDFLGVRIFRKFTVHQAVTLDTFGLVITSKVVGQLQLRSQMIAESYFFTCATVI